MTRFCGLHPFEHTYNVSGDDLALVLYFNMRVFFTHALWGRAWFRNITWTHWFVFLGLLLCFECVHHGTCFAAGLVFKLTPGSRLVKQFPMQRVTSRVWDVACDGWV